jgi:hypothetical protein
MEVLLVAIETPAAALHAIKLCVYHAFRHASCVALVYNIDPDGLPTLTRSQ